jgi:hypothetical protein
MTNEIVTSNKMIEGSVSSNIYMILLGLFAISCYTCFVVGITYLFVIINIPKGQMPINKKYDDENDTRSKNIVEEKVVEEELVPSAPCIDTLVVASVVLFDKNHYINELIRIEKKIAFYDIRQHHYKVDIQHTGVLNDGNGLTVFDRSNRDKRMIMIEYLSRLNDIDSAIFEKKSDELLLFAYYRIHQGARYGSISDVRMKNIGYIIDNEFIEKLVLHTTFLSQSDKSEQRHIDSYEVELMEFANELHNVFYKKLKAEYQKIEYKYSLISPDFTDFDKLMNEVQNNETEILSLDEYDLKRRKLEIREMKILYLK